VSDEPVDRRGADSTEHDDIFEWASREPMKSALLAALVAGLYIDAELLTSRDVTGEPGASDQPRYKAAVSKWLADVMARVSSANGPPCQPDLHVWSLKGSTRDGSQLCVCMQRRLTDLAVASLYLTEFRAQNGDVVAISVGAKR